MNKYDDIINLPALEIYPPRVSRYDRAAQFAPFAALTGFGALINETARLTDKKPELDEDSARLLNERVNIIAENIKLKPEIELTFFVPDKRKQGGSLESFIGRVRRVDEIARELIFTDKTAISLDNVVFIDGNLFKNIAPRQAI